MLPRWGSCRRSRLRGSFAGTASHSHAETAEAMERVAERRTSSGVFELLPFRRSPIAPRHRYPEACGAEPCWGLAALKPPTGGPGQRHPVPDREPVKARLLLNRPLRHVVSVFQARPAPETQGLVPKDRRQSFPLDRPPPPHRSLAMRPSPRRGETRIPAVGRVRTEMGRESSGC